MGSYDPDEVVELISPFEVLSSISTSPSSSEDPTRWYASTALSRTAVS